MTVFLLFDENGENCGRGVFTIKEKAIEAGQKLIESIDYRTCIPFIEEWTVDGKEIGEKYYIEVDE